MALDSACKISSRSSSLSQRCWLYQYLSRCGQRLLRVSRACTDKLALPLERMNGCESFCKRSVQLGSFAKPGLLLVLLVVDNGGDMADGLAIHRQHVFVSWRSIEYAAQTVFSTDVDRVESLKTLCALTSSIRNLNALHPSVRSSPCFIALCCS